MKIDIKHKKSELKRKVCDLLKDFSEETGLYDIEINAKIEYFRDSDLGINVLTDIICEMTIRI